MEYDLEIEKAIEEIKRINAKTVLLQFPDGLKPKATEVAKQLQEHANIQIWLGSCFGSCDIPKANAYLLIAWGHSAWKRPLYP